MNKVKIYNFTTSSYDEYIGEFEKDNQFVFDFPPENHFDSNGNMKFVAQRLVNGVWTDIQSSTNTTISESLSTDGVITLDENGFTAYKLSDPTHPTVVIDKAGNVTIKGTINAISGTIGNWTINGSVLQSSDASISLDSANSTITVGSDANNNVVLSTANGIIAKKGKIAGWTISGNDLQASNLTLTGGTTPQIKLGTNITMTPTLLSVSGGAISITTGYVNDSTKLTINSSGIIAYKDLSNYVKFDSNGLTCIKNGTSIGAAITPDGIIGTLLTDQSVPGSKFDKIPPAVPVILTGVDNTYTYIEQTATSEFINIRVTFNAVADADREGYKIYLKEGASADLSYMYMPVAVVSKTQESGGKVTYDVRNVKSNTVYCIKVTSYDVTGNESDINASTAVQLSGVKDTLAPSIISGLTILPGFKTISISWVPVTTNSDNSTCMDFAYYEVQKSTNGSEYVTIGKVYTNLIMDRNVDYDKSYSYRVRSVDLSGNVSDYVTSSAYSPTKVDSGDIVAHSITTDLINIGSVVKSINATETTLFHFDGTLQSTQGYTPYTEFVDNVKIPHLSGFYRKEAKFGASVSIEESTNNLVAVSTSNNAALRTTTGGWNVSSGSIYRTINGVDGLSDGYLEVDATNDNYVDVHVTAGKKYNVSIYGKNASGTSILRADIKPLDGDSAKWTTANGPSGCLIENSTLEKVIVRQTDPQWNRYYGWFTVPADSSTTSVRLIIRQSEATGATVAIDSVQVEERDYATSFVNGTKDKGYIDYYAPGLINVATGVIAFWARSIIGWHNPANNDHSDAPTIDNWFIYGKEGNPSLISATFDRATSTVTFKYGTASISYALPTSITDEAWVHFAFTWKDGEQAAYVNGDPVGLANASTITTPEDKLFRFGYFPRIAGDGSIIEEYMESATAKRARASLMFDELRIDKVIRDSEEIKSWYTQDSSFYDAAAQIDADSQNISAANASVTINNEGLAVKNGKISVESEDGKILLQDGRLQVNGLDVGVPQSDNAIYNGNFTVTDTTYSMSDPYLSQIGLARYGAKYWNLRRIRKNDDGSLTTSMPLRDDVLLAASWNRVPVSAIMDPADVFDMCKTNVGNIYMTSAKLPPISTSDNSLTWCPPTYTPEPSQPYIVRPDGSHWDITTITTLVKYLFTSIIDKLIYDVGQQAMFKTFDIQNDIDAGNATAQAQDQAAYDAYMAQFNGYKAMKAAFTSTESLRTACVQVLHTVLNDILLCNVALDANTATTVHNNITSQLMAAGVTDTNVIAYCCGVADAWLGTSNTQAQSFPEYITMLQLLNPANNLTTTTLQEKVAVQGAVRASFAHFVGTYNDINNPAYEDTDTVTNSIIDSALIDPTTGALTLLGTAEPFKTGLCTLAKSIVNGMKQTTMITLEQKIDNDTKTSYDKLINYEMGSTTFNDYMGNLVTQIFEVGTPEVWNHVHLHKILGIDTTNPDIAKLINPYSGTPEIGDEYCDGGSIFKIYPYDKKFGREGYAELGVQGPHDETVQLIQEVPNLVVYTDGDQRGKFYKQHTFTFNSVWGTDDSMNVLHDDSASLTFEVQELAGVKKMLPRLYTKGFNPVAPEYEDPTNQYYGMIQSDTPDSLGRVLPKRVTSHFDQIDSNGYFVQAASHSILALSSATGDAGMRQVILNNFVGNVSNGYIYQSLSAGNMEINPKSMSYTLNSVMDALTLNSPDGYITTHPMGKGYIKSGILYFNVKEDGSDVDVSKAPAWGKFIVTDDQGVSHSIIKSNKKGDFITSTFNINTNCNGSVKHFGCTENGQAVILFDNQLYSMSDLSYTKPAVIEAEFKDFRAGVHSVTLVNLGEAGINTSSTYINPAITLYEASIFDYEDTFNGVNNVNNISLYNQPESGANTWNVTYVTPKYTNSLRPDGTPLYPCLTPIKYRARITLNKVATPDATGDTFPVTRTGNFRKTLAWITGIQAELGTNPSYMRLSYGSGSISGYMIQPYSSTMWVTSGIQSKHFEEHLPWYPGETGVQSRHIGNGQITSDKYANESVTNNHIAKSNVTFDKTRIKTVRLMYKSGATTVKTDTLQKSSYGDEDLFVTYIPTMAPAQNSTLYVPNDITVGSEFLIKNGQILDIDDDYSLSRHISFVDSKDLYNMCQELDTYIQNDSVLKLVYPAILDTSHTVESPLSVTEYQRLVAVTSTLDISKYIIDTGDSVSTLDKYLSSKYSLLTCTKITLICPVVDDSNHTDKFKVQFWEEL